MSEEHGQHTLTPETERYEVSELFAGQSRTAARLIKVVGLVVLVVLLALALSFPLRFL
jgi:hypothetical protein